MKKLLMILIISIACFGNNDLNQYLKSKEHLNSIKEIDTFVTSNRESTIGYNVISITIINKENQLVEFKVLKEVPLIITTCDFKLEKNKENNFSYSFNNDCYKILSVTAQKKHVFEIIDSIENQLEFIYKKGDSNFKY